MRLHGPSPPQGKNSGRSLLFSLLPPRIQYSPPQRVGEAGISPLTMEFQDPDWFDLDFQQRIPLTINPGQVPTPQTDFPLLVNDTYPDLIGEVEAEIRFAGSDLVQLEYEIQKFDNVTGELIAWIKKPTLSDNDFLGIYFDNPGASDEQNSPAVWDANYKSVHHMQSNSDDSTGNAQNMTESGIAHISGQIGNGSDYNGTVGSFSIRNPYAGVPSTAMTIELWIKTSSPTEESMFSYAVSTNFDEVLVFGQNNVLVRIAGAQLVLGVGPLADGIFHQFTLTWNSSTGLCIKYIDGVLNQSGNTTTGLSVIDNGSLVLAQDQDSVGGGFQGNQALDGIMDEVRWSNIDRSADYVKTTFNNQDNPGAFYTTGAVESAPSINGGVMEFQDPLLGVMEFQS